MNISGFVSVPRIISVNQKNTYNRGGRVTLTEETRHEMNAIRSSLRDSNLNQNYLKDTNKTFTLHLTFIINSFFGKRDTDNMCKVVQDSITQYLGFNDARITDVHLSKRLISGEKVNYEFIYFNLVENENFDHTISMESIRKLYGIKGN